MKKRGVQTENKANYSQETSTKITKPYNPTAQLSLARELDRGKFNSIHGELKRPSPDRDKQANEIIGQMVTPPTRGSLQKTGGNIPPEATTSNSKNAQTGLGRIKPPL